MDYPDVQEIKAMKAEGKFIIKSFANQEEIVKLKPEQLAEEDVNISATEKKGGFVWKIFSYNREEEMAEYTKEELADLAWEHLLYHKLMTNDRKEMEYSLGLKDRPIGRIPLTPEEKVLRGALKGATAAQIKKALKILSN